MSEKLARKLYSTYISLHQGSFSGIDVGEGQSQMHLKKNIQNGRKTKQKQFSLSIISIQYMHIFVKHK